MRTHEEFEEAFAKVGEAGNADEEEELYQAMYAVLRWATGEIDWDNSVGMYLPD